MSMQVNGERLQKTPQVARIIKIPSFQQILDNFTPNQADCNNYTPRIRTMRIHKRHFSQDVQESALIVESQQYALTKMRMADTVKKPTAIVEQDKCIFANFECANDSSDKKPRYFIVQKNPGKMLKEIKIAQWQRAQQKMKELRTEESESPPRVKIEKTRNELVRTRNKVISMPRRSEHQNAP